MMLNYKNEQRMKQQSTSVLSRANCMPHWRQNLV